MKTTHTTTMHIKKSTILLLAVTAATLTACDKSNADYSQVEVLLNQTQLHYDNNGLWADAMNENANVVSQGITFSHTAVPALNSWTGFVASRNSDTADYSTGNWQEHLYTATTGGGKSGTRTPYLVACWNQNDTVTTGANGASCSFARTDSTEFTPVSMLACNTTRTYYAIINGTSTSKKFADGDWLKLNAYGVTADGKTTGPVEFYLANYSNNEAKTITDWTYVNLETLGRVKTVYFTIQSSDNGQNGINTPTYFAVDRIIIDTKE